MSTDVDLASRYLAELLASHDGAALLERLKPRPHAPLARFPSGTAVTPDILAQRWQTLARATPEVRSQLLDQRASEQADTYQHNIENFIGTVKTPVGIAGPLRVNGLHAQGDYFVPLATTEAALVASYHRGATLISLVGGCTAALLGENLGRAPGFAFKDMPTAGAFLHWAFGQLEAFRQVAESTTRYGKLLDLRVSLEGNHVYLIFNYTTGDAAGQNMVTIATDAVCQYIVQHAPVQPEYWFIEANMSGDKKASAHSFVLTRGKKVSAEVCLPAPLLHRVLHTTPEKMVDYWRMSALGGVLSGTLGVQGHYANGLAALYIACGQDAACVSEAAVGVTRMELTPDGGLYASVMLPNLIIGTVGGGTGLPSQCACLEILGLAGPGQARALAEVAAALCLAGELSIVGALAAGDFTRAHQSLARGQQRVSDAAEAAPAPQSPPAS